MTPTKAKAMIEKHSTGHTPVMVSATDFTTVAHFICAYTTINLSVCYFCW
jgi:hypothetical protein